jgi:hypothetical protein
MADQEQLVDFIEALEELVWRQNPALCSLSPQTVEPCC